MKKKKIISMLLTVAMIIGLTACSGSGDTTSTEPAEAETTEAETTGTDAAEAETSESSDTVHKIGVSIPTLQEERWQNDYNYFTEEAASMSNVELIIQVADLDAEQQNTQIESMITQGVEAIIVCPVDVATIGATLDAAAEAGIYICAYCRLPENCSVDMMTWFDPIVVAETNASVAYEKCQTGNWVMLSGDIDNGPETDEFFTGWHNVIQEAEDAGDITVVMEQYVDDWSSDNAMVYAEAVLSQYNNDIQVFLCGNDGISRGVIQACENAGIIDDVIITGNDADYINLGYLLEGKIASTTAQDTRQQCKLALESAVDLIENDGVLPDTYNDQITGYYSNGKLDDIPVVAVYAEGITSREDIQTKLIDTGLRDASQIQGW